MVTWRVTVEGAGGKFAARSIHSTLRLQSPRTTAFYNELLPLEFAPALTSAEERNVASSRSFASCVTVLFFIQSTKLIIKLRHYISQGNYVYITLSPRHSVFKTSSSKHFPKAAWMSFASGSWTDF